MNVVLELRDRHLVKFHGESGLMMMVVVARVLAVSRTGIMITGLALLVTSTGVYSWSAEVTKLGLLVLSSRAVSLEFLKFLPGWILVSHILGPRLDVDELSSSRGVAAELGLAGGLVFAAPMLQAV